MNQQKALDIVVEGLAGSGKSTQLELLIKYLQNQLGLRVFRTREPGGSEIADAIRYVAQAQLFHHEEMDPLAEAYLFAASRAQTLPMVAAARKRYNILLRDRDVVSSLANQAFGRGLGFDVVWDLNRMAIEANNGLPDFYLFIDTPAEVAVARLNDAAGDKFEKLGTEYHLQVAAGYKFISQHPIFKERWIRVDGNGTINEVHDRVLEAVLPLPYTQK